MSDILRQASDGFSIVCFVLDTIETGENNFEGSPAANVRGKPGDGIEANRRRVFAYMGKSDFHAVRKARECHLQLRMSRAQMFESFRASGDDGGLQSGDGVVLESRSVGKKADHASGRGRQTGVGIEEQPDCLGFSGHGCWPERRRRLPGNLGNSRDRRSKGARSAAPCKWCNIFRRSSGLRASHIAHKGSDLA